MSKEIERLNLEDFVEQYVGHNTTICLFSMNIFKNEEGMLVKKFTKLWEGMDWQIGSGDREYFKAHPDVFPCPFNDCKVESVIGNNIAPARTHAVSLIIDINIPNLNIN